MTTEDDPTGLAATVALERGTLIEEAMRRVAAAPDRVVTAAEKAWTIAGAIGGVLVAVGFTDQLRDAPGLVQVAGVAAVTLWLVAAVAFMRVSVPLRPRHLKDPLRAAYEELATLGPRPEAYGMDQVFIDNLAKTTASREALASRLRRAVGLALAATVATAVALAALVIVPRDVDVTGPVLLTVAGQTAIAAACPEQDSEPVLDGDGVEVGRRLTDPPVATVDPTPLPDDTVELVLAAGECDPRQEVVITLAPDAVVTLADG